MKNLIARKDLLIPRKDLIPRENPSPPDAGEHIGRAAAQRGHVLQELCLVARSVGAEDGGVGDLYREIRRDLVGWDKDLVGWDRDIWRQSCVDFSRLG